MRLLFILVISIALSRAASAQSASDQPLYIIYVDNSKLGDNDGMDDGMLNNSLYKITDTIKARKANFVYLISDKGNYNSTDNLASLDKVNNDVTNHAPRFNVDQREDMKELEDLAFEKITKVNPKEIKIFYYLSNDLAKKAGSSYAPLIAAFPKMIAQYAEVKSIESNIIISKLTNAADVEKIRACFDFYKRNDDKTKIKTLVSSL